METKEYKLTDVCDFQGGTQPPKEEWIAEPRDGYVRMLQIRDFTQDKAEHIGFVKDTKKLNKCNKDDILIGRYGASVGKILTGLEGAYNVAIIKTIPNEELLSKRYLFYVLTGTDFQNFILTIGARAAQAGFNKNDLSLFKLHLPSIKEQNKIVSLLDKSELLLRLREKSIVDIYKLVKFLFIKFFGDPFSNKSIGGKTIKDVAKRITYGFTRPMPHYESGIPIITAKNVLHNEIDFENVHYTNKESYDELTDKCKPQIGDILIVKDGVTLGRTAMVNKEHVFCISQAVTLLIPKRDKVLPKYILHYLLSDSVQNRIKAMAKGNAMPHLQITEFAKFPIPLPDIELQKKFIEIIDHLEFLKIHYLKSLKEIDNLNISLRQKAFKGELDIIENFYFEGAIKIKPKISGEIITIEGINKELEAFHKSQPHTGAPNEINNTIRQLEAELKIKGEIPFWDEYVKYRIVKGKFKEPFTFEQLWAEITKFPFETVPEYDEVAALLFKWLAEENAFIRQQFNESTKQIELVLNETAKA